MTRFQCLAFVLLALPAALMAATTPTPPKPKGEATITSDELELIDNGARTTFIGHVVLRQDPYVLKADRMTRAKASGVVDARGNVEGTWVAATGESFIAKGDKGRYTPSIETTELWGRSRVSRWETAKDTAPLVVTADRFIADQKEGTIRAVGNVEVTQSTRSRVRSEEALYVQKEKVIHLFGPNRVFVHWEDARGIYDFEGSRGRLTLEPKAARLEERVKGHVVPL